MKKIICLIGIFYILTMPKSNAQSGWDNMCYDDYANAEYHASMVRAMTSIEETGCWFCDADSDYYSACADALNSLQNCLATNPGRNG